MGILTLQEQRANLEDPDTPISDGFTLLDIFGGRPSASGIRVNNRTARNFSAVYAAIDIIASHIGQLPVKLYERRDDGGKGEVRTHPAFGVVHDAANPEMTAVSYKEAKQGHLLTRGNAFSEIIFNGRGQATELWPLDPDTTTLHRRDDGTPFYRVRADDESFTLPFSKVLHIPGLGGDGMRGWSVIKLARESIGLGLATEEYGARFFSNNSVPRGVLVAPESLKDDQKLRLKQQWESAQGGLSQAHRVAVLEGGLEWQQLGLTAEDSQFLETRKFQVREIARWFRVPPHKIRDLEDATFSNIEAQNIEFVQDTLLPWIRRWEQALNHKLLSDRERSRGLFFEFNVDGLLRGDSEKRSQMMQVRFNTGSWSPNDIRRLENENPIDGGDQYFMPLNMIPLDQADSVTVTERAIAHALENGDGESVRSLAELRKAELEAPKQVESRSPAMRLRLRDAFRDLFRDAADRLVGREANAVRRFADRFLGDNDPTAFLGVIEKYYFQRSDPEDELDDGDFVTMARDIMGPVFSSYGDAVGQAAAEEVGEEEAEAIAEFVRDYTDGFVRRHAARSRRQLEKLVAEEENPAEAIEQRTDEWRDGSDTRQPRDERVTVEEINKLGNAVTKAVWAGAGILAIRWLTVGDSCPYCRSLSGRVVGIRDSFIGAGESFEPDGADAPLRPSTSIGHPPAHPGCDCTITSA